MMISPGTYKMQNEDKSLKELIKERKKLINEIFEYEKDYINGDKKEELEVMINPDPDTRYYCNNLYLKEITDLIIQRRNEIDDAELEHVPDSLKEYVYFVDGKVYAKQKIPKDLEEEYTKFEKEYNSYDESLKLYGNKYAEDIETKKEYEEFIKMKDDYNEKLAKGEDPGINMGYVANQYQKQFYDEALEKEIQELDKEKVNTDIKHIDELLAKVEEELNKINKED